MGGGGKRVLRGPSLHPHVPSRLTQFYLFFGLYRGLLARHCVIKDNSQIQRKACGEARMRTRQLRVETSRDPWGVSNTTEHWSKSFCRYNDKYQSWPLAKTKKTKTQKRLREQHIVESYI